MTYGAYSQDFAYVARGGQYREPNSRVIVGLVALMVGASASLWMCYAPLPSDPAPVTTPQAAAVPPTAPLIRLAATRGTPRDMPPSATPTRRDPALFDPGFMTADHPAAFAQSTALRARFEPLRRNAITADLTPTPMAMPPEQAQHGQIAAAPLVVASAEPTSGDVDPGSKTIALTDDADDAPVLPLPPVASKLVESLPLPPTRPTMLRTAENALPHPAATRQPQQAMQAIATAAPPARPSFFEKLFGRQQQQPNTVLAYANPEDGAQGLISRPVAGFGQQTAIYDISAHTVILPDGTRLEAHSGIGANKDNPNSVTLHMRGATPPNVYDLTQREALFHGVRALRLTPVGGTTFGRVGLLAHTFMLGPNGDSNGCVVFRDYKAFLRAYDNGQIRRLAVVARAN